MSGRVKYWAPVDLKKISVARVRGGGHVFFLMDGPDLKKYIIASYVTSLSARSTGPAHVITVARR